MLRIQKLELELLGIKPLTGILLIGNFMGAFIGFLYYFDIIGLTQYSPILWILIPDCPMAVFLLLGVYIQFDKQRFSNYTFFVFIQGIRASILTYLMFINYGSIRDNEIVALGHLLLFIQAAAILPLLIGMKFTKGTFISIGITFLNDLTDFFGILGITKPTLAQLPTIQPMFSSYVIAIFALDFFLILIGLGFARIMDQEAEKNSEPILEYYDEEE